MYIYACRKLSGAGGSTTTKPSRRIGGGVGVVVIQTKTVVSLYEASAIVFVIISARICTGGAPLVDLGDGRKYYGVVASRTEGLPCVRVILSLWIQIMIAPRGRGDLSAWHSKSDAIRTQISPPPPAPPPQNVRQHVGLLRSTLFTNRPKLQALRLDDSIDSNSLQ